MNTLIIIIALILVSAFVVILGIVFAVVYFAVIRPRRESNKLMQQLAMKKYETERRSE